MRVWTKLYGLGYGMALIGVTALTGTCSFLIYWAVQGADQ